MNYFKIHNDLIAYCKNSTPRERLIKRNPTDERIDHEYLYTENHHIIPKHDGGTNHVDNFVTLLPEEHYIIHLLRYKALKQRGDFLAVRFIVNGFNSNKATKFITESTYRKVRRWKHYIQKFRKETGWHTEQGVKNISKAQVGWFNSKDDDGNIIRVRVDDPRVLSGELVHHTTGTRNVRFKESGLVTRIPIKDFDPNIHENDRCQKGKNNSNYREMTPEHIERFKKCIIDSADEEGYVFRKYILEKVKEEFTEFKRVNLKWFDNNLDLDTVCKECNTILYRTGMKTPKSKRLKISNAVKLHNKHNKHRIK